MSSIRVSEQMQEVPEYSPVPGHNTPVVCVCRDLVTRWQSVLFQVLLGEEVEGFLWIKSRKTFSFKLKEGGQRADSLWNHFPQVGNNAHNLVGRLYWIEA